MTNIRASRVVQTAAHRRRPPAIAEGVSRLEQAGHQAARAVGIVSIASEEATPQIPPIATPYSTRSRKNSINDGAAAEQLKAEKNTC